MECNRDEAERAKAIAEMKLQHQDFHGARKIALKAQRLYADLENISQMLMVCEVHCSAEEKLPGAEMDWYGILQLDRSANEAAIKKRYQKFALQLHPDKNKFPGAESAFKLVGEAHRVLLDQERQKMHEMKRNAPLSTEAPMNGNSNEDNGLENDVRGNSSGFNLQYTKAPPPQAGFPDCLATFWTICPFCSVKYQYYRRVVNRKLCCHKCRKIFVAYDLNVSSVSQDINMDKPKLPDQDPFPNHGNSNEDNGAENDVRGNSSGFNLQYRKAPPPQDGFPDCLATFWTICPFCSVKYQYCRRVVNRKLRCVKCLKVFVAYDLNASGVSPNNNMDKPKFPDQDPFPNQGYPEVELGPKAASTAEIGRPEVPDKMADQNAAPSAYIVKNRKRRRGDGGSSGGTDSENSAEFEDQEKFMNEDGHFRANQCSTHVRTAAQQSQKVSCKDSLSEDDDDEPVVLSDRVQGNGQLSEKEEKRNSLQEEAAFKGARPDGDEKADVESIDIPDSDFHNFDDSKSNGNFQTGQVWALYSEEDSLPKYYGQITKITPNPQFKLHIRWLTRCVLPNDVTGRKNEDMLNSSWKFKLKKGKPSVYTATTAFSHQMKVEQHVEAGFFEIFPQKGDVWALHRCWNLEMSCSALERCSYDLVEVTERNDSVVRVSVLEQVDGFVSVFKCQLLGSLKVMLEIPMAEILRFSHQVPAVQLDEESNGSLRGCWDIDTAAMPVLFFRSK